MFFDDMFGARRCADTPSLAAGQPGPATAGLDVAIITVLLTCGLGGMPIAQAQEASSSAGQKVVSGSADNAYAVVKEHQFYDIPAGALSAVLAEFAARSGVALSFDPSVLEDQASAGLRGRFGVRQGFERILSGSGYELVVRTNGYSLRRSQAPRVSALTPVVVRGEHDPRDDAYRTAASTHYLSRDDIERFRGTSVGDIFQGIPGVLVGENRNSGGLDINIRGMQGQGRVPVLVDGARQETTVYRGYSGAASRSFVDPDLIGGIEIEKGPTMNAHGTGATGGLVSMRTIGASDIVKEGETFGVRVRGTAIGNNSGSPSAAGTPGGYNVGVNNDVYRTNCMEGLEFLCEGNLSLDNLSSDETMDRPALLQPKSWAGSIALAQRLEWADFVVAYAKRRQGNYYAGTHGPVPWLDLSETYERGFYTEVRPKLEGATRFRAGERIANTNYESGSLLLKGKFFLTTDQDLELSYLRYHSTYGELMPSQLRGIGEVRQTQGSEVTASTYSARYRWNPADSSALDLRANVWYTDTDSLSESYAEDELNAGFFDNLGAPERYQRFGLDVSNTSHFGQDEASWLRYGFAAQHEKLGPPTPLERRGSFFDSHAGKRWELSAFTAVQWKPWRPLTVDAGLRYTWFRSKDDTPVYTWVNETLPSGVVNSYCRDDDGDGQCDTTRASNTRGGVAPIVALTWEPTEGWQLYARYAEAYRMPSLFEGTYGFSVSPSQDINLKPEHAKNREVGVNYMLDGAFLEQDTLRLRFAYFRNHTKNYLTRTSPNTWEAGYGQQFYTLRNIRSASFHGLEVSGRYDAGGFFADFGGTRYTHIETCHYGSYRREECTDYGIANSYINNMIPPKWHASATLGARLFDRRLTLGVRGTFMGARTRQPEYNDQTKQGSLAPVPWHAYRVFDVFASYRINKDFTVDFNIDNITDRYYLDALSLGRVPAPGRTARLSVTAQF
ncbi:TonB-dependent receptor domain-containing protein [Kerstersia similis]|uniref:TonB-dependent receptor n=1 Tax=Kerstersia similis TaxID=206505 RepID=UPI0039F0EBCC